MLALGDFRFGIATAAFQELQRSHSWRWPSIERIGAKPALQFVGPGDETIRMNGTIYPSFRGGLGQIDGMRVEANKGEPLRLVDGAGLDWGFYCITEINETRKVFFSDGTPRAQDFDLCLSAFGGDPDASSPAPLGLDLGGVLDALPVPDLSSLLSDPLAALGDPLAFAQTAASKALLGLPDVRSLVGITTGGIGALTGAITSGATALGGLDGLARSVSAVTGAISSLQSASGLEALVDAGIHLDQVVAQATSAGGSPLTGLLGALGSLPANGTATLGRALSGDELTVFTALVAEAGNGGL